MSKISNTKKQAILERYLNAKNRSLYDCYKNSSIYKQRIYDDFIRIKNNKGGKGLKIVSFNSQIFTIGFTVDYVDINLKYSHSVLFYDTPIYHYEIAFDKRDGKII